MDQFNDNDLCFVCGSRNERGLKLVFKTGDEPDQVESEVIFPGEFQGWDRVVHGGLVSTVLDEIMVKAAQHKGFKCVTAQINVKFRKPAPTGQALKLMGKITEIKRKIICTEGILSDPHHDLIASATARLFIVP